MMPTYLVAPSTCFFAITPKPTKGICWLSLWRSHAAPGVVTPLTLIADLTMPSAPISASGRRSSVVIESVPPLNWLSDSAGPLSA